MKSPNLKLEDDNEKRVNLLAKNGNFFDMALVPGLERVQVEG